MTIPPIPVAPALCPASLDELWDTYATLLYLPPDVVEQFHLKLLRYLEGPNARHLIRKVRGLVRGIENITADGTVVVGTDNAPSWWVHAVLRRDGFSALEDFDKFINSIPTHMFQVRGVRHANAARWHFAHIKPAKDGNTDWEKFSREEVRNRTIRNFHPCNIFFVPRGNWRVAGGNPDVIRFHQSKFRAMYGAVAERFFGTQIGDEPLRVNVQFGPVVATSSGRLLQGAAIAASQDNPLDGVDLPCLAPRLNTVPDAIGVKKWTLNGRDGYYSRLVKLAASPLHINLSLRIDDESPPTTVGLFRLDLKGLLERKIIRNEPRGDTRYVRVIIRLCGDRFFLRLNNDAPSLELI